MESGRPRVELYDEEGRSVGGFDTGLNHNDIAISPSGHIMITRRSPGTEPPGGDAPRPPGGVDIHARDGTLIASIEGGDSLYFPSGVDVGADGTIYVIDWRPSPEPIPPPSPRPTAQPARRLGRSSGAKQYQVQDPPGDGPPEAIVIFEADLSLRDRVPFYAADDVAVGPAGVFVSRQLEVFDLFAPEPVWSGPSGAIFIPYYGAPLHLDVPERGAPLSASLDHCWFQGMIEFADLSRGVVGPTYQGQLDRPALAGPWRPSRIDAGATHSVHVLQERFDHIGSTGSIEPNVLAGRWGSEPQSVQRLLSNGWPTSQIGLCGDDQAWFERRSEARRVLDVAVDGDSGEELVFTIEPKLARARSVVPSKPLPAWTLWPGSLDPPGVSTDADLRAIDADGGSVGILDGGSGRVIIAPAKPIVDVVDESHVVSLPVDAAASTDLALLNDETTSNGSIALIDAGARRLRMVDYDLGDFGGPIKDGAVTKEWSIADTPIAVAAAPSDLSGASATRDLFVLGAGNWIMRYRQDGELVASWPMPDDGPIPPPGAAPLETLALDLSVDPDGRVLVPFVRRTEHSRTMLGETWWRIEDAGVWVFEADGPPVISSVPPGACLAAPTKIASPRSMRLGGQVEVSLEVSGLCPSEREPIRTMIVLDTSRSMGWDAALPRAQSIARALIDSHVPLSDGLGIITFAEEPKLRAPIGSARGDVAREIAAARAGGDTVLGPALDLAASALGIEPGRPLVPGERATVVVVTDGRPTDHPIDAASALIDGGATLRFIVVPGRDYQSLFTTILANLAGGERSSVLVAPDKYAVRSLVGALGRETRPEVLFEGLAVVDEVPVNMRYVEGSADPPAVWNPTARTLTWTFGAVPQLESASMRFLLEPLETGTWPTNVHAQADGTDGLGSVQRLIFPIPSVSVWSPESLVERIYLPFTSALRCLRPGPRDVAIIIDTSRSMEDPTRAGGQTRVEAAVLAARTFIERSSSIQDRTSIVTFNAEARILHPLSSDTISLDRSLETVITEPGTSIDLGLRAAMESLVDARPRAVRAVLLLTDGRHSGSSDDVRRAALELEVDGNLVFAIGLGSDVDAALLEDISSSGGYAAAAEADALARVFALLDETIRCAPSRTASDSADTRPFHMPRIKR